MFWFFIDLIAAFFWVGWAFGLIHYEPWLVTGAFLCMAINSIIGALKAVVGE